MKYYFIPNFIIALFMVTSANAQIIEPEYLQTFQEWERSVPGGYLHDFKVGIDSNIYIAVEVGIYEFDQDNNTFSVIPGTEELLQYPSLTTDISIFANGEILFFDETRQLKIVDENQVNTLPLYHENIEDGSFGIHAVVADNSNQIYFSGFLPLFPVEDRNRVILVRNEDGNVEIVAGGGEQEITDEPQNRFNVKIEEEIDDLFVFEDGTVIFGWNELENNDFVYKFALIRNDGMITPHMSYTDEFSRLPEYTFATKNHLFYAAGGSIKFLQPDMSTPIDLVQIPSTDRHVSELYMDYSPTDDTLYVMSQELNRLVLWKVPNVLSTLQSHVKGWEIYE